MKLLIKIILLIIIFININMGTQSCVFCNIKNIALNGILYEDDKIIIFNYKSPAATVHLQCIPKRHIKNKNYLTKNDLSLLNHMYNTARDYLILNYKELLINNQPIFGFHKPPFYTVNHLHMHCIIPPYTKIHMKILNYCILEDFDSLIHDIENKD